MVTAGTSASSVEQSRAITRNSASNLALAFILLPKERRDAMAALYAFCRQVDDVADEEAVPVPSRRAQLAAWRADLARACIAAGVPAPHAPRSDAPRSDAPRSDVPHFPVNRELVPVIRHYRLAYEHFDALIQGCEMDLDTQRYADYPDLELYCYRVASVVGLLSIEIFGYTNPACRDYAVYLGKALQLTNILRDVHTDAARGRIYLPQSELQRHGVTEEEILRGQYSERYAALAESVAARAREFYRLAREALPPADRRHMIAAELMGEVYRQLLRKLERQQFNVFGPRPLRLTKPHKLFLILRTWARLTLIDRG